MSHVFELRYPMVGMKHYRNFLKRDINQIMTSMLISLNILFPICFSSSTDYCARYLINSQAKLFDVLDYCIKLG